jgi:hypothetical protein
MVKPRVDEEVPTLTIEKCPLCGEPHEYDFTVQESGIMYATAPPPRSFTRLFTCPTKGGTFQSTITTSGYVEDVQIGGLHRPES